METPVSLLPYLDNTDNQNLSVTSPTSTTRMIHAALPVAPALRSVWPMTTATRRMKFRRLLIHRRRNYCEISSSNSVTIPETQNLGQVLTQGNDAGGQKITNLATPTANADAATKQYVDNADAVTRSRGCRRTMRLKLISLSAHC